MFVQIITNLISPHKTIMTKYQQASSELHRKPTPKTTTTIATRKKDHEKKKKGKKKKEKKEGKKKSGHLKAWSLSQTLKSVVRE